MIDLDAVAKAAFDLEPLPASAARLAELARNPDAELKEILDVVTYDAPLTGRVLRAANSSASAASRAISSVRDAVVRLGSGHVLEIAIGSSMASKLATAIPELELAEGELWRHSVTAAVAVEEMKSAVKIALPPEAFTAALLHDVGKIVLARFVTSDLLNVMKMARTSGGVDSLRAELDVFGVHHGEIGALIARHWNLPEAIVEGIQHHHEPDLARSTIAHFVCVANVVAHLADEDRDAALRTSAEPSFAMLGLDNAAVDAVVEKVRAAKDAVLGRFD